MADEDKKNVAKAAQDQVKKVVGTSFQCIMALLQFILADPILRSVIIGFLETLKAQIAAQKALLQLAVAQLTITIALLESEVAALGAVFVVADGLGNRFPLGVFMRCPLTAAMVNGAKEGVAKLLPSASGGTFDFIKSAKTAIRDIQYKVARMNQMLDQTNAAIENCTLLTDQITAIQDFINALADYPGQFTLPLT